MCGKKDLLIYFFDIPQRHVSRQCGGYVLDRHGDLAVPLVPDVAALDPGEHGRTRAAEIALGSRGRVLLRASGTEPVIRVMVEGEDAALVEQQARTLAEVVRSSAA